jgi:aspartate 1-decarboxylase
MQVKVLKSKLHRARVTDATLHYAGSIAIDEELMRLSGILPYEMVLVADLDNGNRLETYVVPAEPASRRIGILGAAAQLIQAGHTVIIMGFALCMPDEAAELIPKVVVLDENNEIVKQG